ncbi:MAG: patatin-like phospholipase family protein [Candidatus Bipolaricaulia bacterium]
MKRPLIGLVLSSGGARGAAHTGVLKVLAERRIPIDTIVGTSMGAMVGGVYAAGVSTERIEEEWLKTDIMRVARSFLPTFPLHGWSSGSTLYRALQSLVGDARIEELPLKFAAVATDIETGEEVVIQEGLLVDAIRASSSVPGLFVPVELDGRFLVDGGLVNPLPVDVARRLGAEIVIAVDVGYYPRRIERKPGPGFTERAIRFVEERFGGLIPDNWIEPLKGLSGEEREELRRSAPGVISILILASVILQRRIVELNNKITPPDVLIRPELRENPPRYHSAQGGIAAGEAAAKAALEEIERLLAARRESSRDH